MHQKRVQLHNSQLCYILFIGGQVGKWDRNLHKIFCFSSTQPALYQCNAFVVE